MQEKDKISASSKQAGLFVFHQPRGPCSFVSDSNRRGSYSRDRAFDTVSHVFILRSDSPFTPNSPRVEIVQVWHVGKLDTILGCLDVHRQDGEDVSYLKALYSSLYPAIHPHHWC